MGHHLTEDKKFKSDKYAWCPEGFFALKLTDPLAQEAILLYANKTGDVELKEDLMEAIKIVKEENGNL